LGTTLLRFVAGLDGAAIKDFEKDPSTLTVDDLDAITDMELNRKHHFVLVVKVLLGQDQSKRNSDSLGVQSASEALRERNHVWQSQFQSVLLVPLPRARTDEHLHALY